MAAKVPVFKFQLFQVTAHGAIWFSDLSSEKWIDSSLVRPRAFPLVSFGSQSRATLMVFVVDDSARFFLSDFFPSWPPSLQPGL